MLRPQTRFGNLVLGLAPKVVGTVSQAGTLEKLAAGSERQCDIVEIRLDLIDTDHWLDHAKAIEAQGLPVLATLRLASEGGKWTRPDAERLPVLETALTHLTAVDIEFRSPLLEKVSAFAASRQKALIISYHDFERTPPVTELRQVIRKAANYGTVVKIATLTQTEADLATLRELFTEQCSASVCLLGMGALGPVSRTLLPQLGSCLTYGYLDAPIAPGQVAASELRRQLAGAITESSARIPAAQ